MEPNQAQESNKFLVPVAIVVAGALIAGAIYAGGTKTDTAVNSGQNQDVKVVPVNQDDHYFGSKDAKVVVVEYSDTECPFCKVFHNTMHQIVEDYQGEVAWVYRHLPIPQLHAKANKEAEATECVAELGGNEAFWKFLDNIFATTNSNDSLDLNRLPSMAQSAGVDPKAFTSCLSSGRYTEKVKDSAEEGFASGARGTPYSIIMTKDGQQGVINGAEPIASVKAKIDAALQ
jgi:protein-disulfide isomerase